jgi:hypothetical protein
VIELALYRKVTFVNSFPRGRPVRISATFVILWCPLVIHSGPRLAHARVEVLSRNLVFLWQWFTAEFHYRLTQVFFRVLSGNFFGTSFYLGIFFRFPRL